MTWLEQEFEYFADRPTDIAAMRPKDQKRFSLLTSVFLSTSTELLDRLPGPDPGAGPAVGREGLHGCPPRRDDIFS